MSWPIEGTSTYCGDPRHAPCGQCRGEVVVGRFEGITVPRIDDDGFWQMDAEGNVLKITLPLPMHVVDVPHSRFDPTGLIGSQCLHGLPDHPDPVADFEGKKRGAQSFIRSKYVIDGGTKGICCVVCEGKDAPDDLVTPRAQA